MKTVSAKKFVVLLAAIFPATGCKTSANTARLNNAAPELDADCTFGGPEYSRLGSPGAENLEPSIWRIIAANALASRLAYEKQPKIEETASKWGFTEVDTIKSGSMSAFVMSNRNCVVLAFRGTDMFSLRDWVVDFRVGSVKVRQGSVHRGFYRAWSGMRRDVVGALNRHGADNKILWVTGHSLGGALAGMYAYSETFERLIFKGPRIHRIVTFGQPLFTDEALAGVMRNEFVGRYFRVVNDLDIVATIPPRFTHFGSLVWFLGDRVDFRPDIKLVGSDGSGIQAQAAEIPPELAPSEQNMQEFLDATASPSGATRGESDGINAASASWPKKIADHFMNGYLERLRIEIEGL